MISVTVPFLGAQLPLETPTMPPKPTAWLGHEPFAFWLTDALKPASFVELGVHFGVSYCAFCEAVQSLGLPTRCLGVDTWQGDEHAGHYAGERILADLRDYHDPIYGRFSTLRRGRFEEAAAEVADGSVDLLHIDGFHTYEAVRHDYETWAPKLSNRAIVLFHDTAVLDRGFGVHRFFAEVSANRPHFAFRHGHGLGVLAHGDALTPPLEALFGADETEAQRIRTVFETLGERMLRERAHISTLVKRMLPGWTRKVARRLPFGVGMAVRRAVG